MKIKDMEVGEFSLPLKRPFKTALRTATHLEVVAVRVTADNGAVGYGEAPPTPVITGETKDSIRAAILGYIRPALAGMHLADFDGVMQKLHACMVHNTSAKAAVDMALYDLRCQALGIPLYELLGGARREITTDITISVNDTQEMVADACDAIARGYDILKVKVGKDPAGDAARVAAIRTRIGPAPRIRVDANQGWSAKEAVAIISRMEDMGLDIELVEQPVPARDLAGMRYITRRVFTPILADEAVFSPADALTVIRMGAADLINIKLMKTGGIWQAQNICGIAEAAGVECMMGCMLESKLAVSAAAHLCAGRSIITRADLDGPSLCAENPFTGGPEFDEARITMNDTPGIGITGIPCENWQRGE